MSGGEPVAFSILLNNYRPEGDGSAREELDQVVLMLVGSLEAR